MNKILKIGIVLSFLIASTVFTIASTTKIQINKEVDVPDYIITQDATTGTDTANDIIIQGVQAKQRQVILNATMNLQKQVQRITQTKDLEKINSATELLKTIK